MQMFSLWTAYSVQALFITSYTHASGHTYIISGFYQDSEVALHTAAFIKKQLIASQNCR
jgi:hypothetical protein